MIHHLKNSFGLSALILFFLYSHAQAQTLPYATQRAAQQFPVTLYTNKDCTTLCQDARQFLQKRGVPYTEKVISQAEGIAELKRLTGQAMIPSLQVGRTGFSGLNESVWQTQLSAAGYPNSPLPANYRPTVQQEEATAKPKENPTATNPNAGNNRSVNEAPRIPTPPPPPLNAPPGFRF
ncbi:glutaredoxin family protein [Parvibium lacunae]|uniref:Glutaredoxin family protein n=1 Tax=Parvibium lacunae TaxID=1888893 RepID=A0A368L772_9BURK|nr:glutaredoxin family protein [Parvibium lacunae]RCS59467.1 glutaredoxin family protein [Parvibium lacunae]